MPLQIIRQDITKIAVDAIVNTTNSEMIGFSGVDLAVHTIAGEELDMECRKLTPLGLGQAKLTGAYKLPSKHIIHTVGPVWRGGMTGESIMLRSCYIECLKLAVKNGFKSVAFPLISSGAYGFPKDQVLRFAVSTITEFLFENELMVYLCVYDKEAYSFSKKLFNDIQAFINDNYVEDFSDEYYEEKLDSLYISSVEKKAPTPMKCCMEMSSAPIGETSLPDFLKNMDKSFSQMLFDFIDERGITDVECYKNANVDKKTFSKIKCNKNYKPSKATVIAFAISLHLDLEKTQALLATVGFVLSKSKVFDKIIMYYIMNEHYNIFDINQSLFEFDQPLLGGF